MAPNPSGGAVLKATPAQSSVLVNTSFPHQLTAADNDPDQHTRPTKDALSHSQMVPPRGSCSVKKMRMPQTIVPASIAADKTKLYLDHQSKLILRTRYSARAEQNEREREPVQVRFGRPPS